MANATKKMVLGSGIATGLVAAMAAIDLILGFPFSGNMVMDIMFLVSCALVGYMCWDTYRDLA